MWYFYYWYFIPVMRCRTKRGNVIFNTVSGSTNTVTSKKRRSDTHWDYRLREGWHYHNENNRMTITPENLTQKHKNNDNNKDDNQQQNVNKGWRYPKQNYINNSNRNWITMRITESSHHHQLLTTRWRRKQEGREQEEVVVTTWAP